MLKYDMSKLVGPATKGKRKSIFIALSSLAFIGINGLQLFYLNSSYINKHGVNRTRRRCLCMGAYLLLYQALVFTLAVDFIDRELDTMANLFLYERERVNAIINTIPIDGESIDLGTWDIDIDTLNAVSQSLELTVASMIVFMLVAHPLMMVWFTYDLWRGYQRKLEADYPPSVNQAFEDYRNAQ